MFHPKESPGLKEDIPITGGQHLKLRDSFRILALMNVSQPPDAVFQQCFVKNEQF